MAAPLRRIPQTDSAMSLATKELIAYLQQKQPGDFIPYAELMQLTGLDTHVHLMDLLATARAYLRTIARLEFEPKRGEGLLCLTDRGKVGLMRKRRKEVHTRSTKTVVIGQTVDVTALTAEEKYLHLAELSVNAAVALATHEQTVQAIEAQRTPQPLLIDPRSYKDLFKGL